MLHIKKCTPSVMVYGELGKLPLSVEIKNKLLNFWCRLINGNECKLSYVLYNVLLQLHLNNIYDSEWLLYVKSLIIEIGEPQIWFSQSTGNVNRFKKLCKMKIQDLYINYWFSKLSTSRSCTNYRIYKNNFNLEEYLIKLPPMLSSAMCKFKTTNNTMPVNQHNNVNNNVCILCDDNMIGDEFHYLLQCNHFTATRKLMLSKHYYVKPNTFKLKNLFNVKSKSTLLKLSKFCKIIIDTLKET